MLCLTRAMAGVNQLAVFVVSLVAKLVSSSWKCLEAHRDHHHRCLLRLLCLWVVTAPGLFALFLLLPLLTPLLTPPLVHTGMKVIFPHPCFPLLGNQHSSQTTVQPLQVTAAFLTTFPSIGSSFNAFPHSPSTACTQAVSALSVTAFVSVSLC